MIKKIYLDCTHTYYSGLNTGIQRVVKNIVKNSFVVSKELNLEIIPVIYHNFEYKRFDYFPEQKNSKKKTKIKIFLKKVFNFIRNFFKYVPILNRVLHNPDFILKINSFYEKLFVNAKFESEKIIFSKNDILFLIDSTWLNNKFDFYKSLKKDYEIKIFSLVYDLIPINQSQFCSTDLTASLINWFKNSNGVVDKYYGISKFVRDECYEYLKKEFDKEISKEKFDYFYLGADIKDGDINISKIDIDFKDIFNPNSTFLTVSTLEPRKNHKYILDVFEKLWEKNVDVKYVIIGKIGWDVDYLVKRIKNHKEYNKRLFMLTNIDDEHLCYAYQNSKALIFASYIEGFGLPIIEGLYNKLQVLASDIKIHKEIGLNFVSYFDLSKTDSLVELIEKDNFYKDLSNFKWISWEESTKDLILKVSEVE